MATADDNAPFADLLDRFRWLALPACASLMLLAATNHVCQDVAVVPFLWVVPLASICFRLSSLSTTRDGMSAGFGPRGGDWRCRRGGERLRPSCPTTSLA